MGIRAKIEKGMSNLSDETKNFILDKRDQAEALGKNELIRIIMDGTGCNYEESVRACQGYTDEPEPY